MKCYKYLIIIFLVNILGTSCGNDTKKATSEMENTTQNVKNAKQLTEGATEMQENIQQLRTKEHLTKEQWKSWLPASLLGLPLSHEQINFIPGLGSCAATYRDGNKKIRVMVIDGAGEKGAGGVGTYRMSSKIDYDTNDKWGYTKTILIDGVKTKKSYVKTSDMFNLSMFYANRFAVDIEAHKLPEASLEQIVKELNLNTLKKF